LTGAAPGATKQVAAAETPLRRAGRSEEIAAVVAFLPRTKHPPSPASRFSSTAGSSGSEPVLALDLPGG
jgi:hypothetical protein